MTKRDTHRVMPHEKGWQVKRNGDQKASHVADTKKGAEKLHGKLAATKVLNYRFMVKI